jgi:pyruvyltransferase
MNKEEGNFVVTYNNRNIIPDSTTNWGDLIPFSIVKFFSKSPKLTEQDVFSVKHPNRHYTLYSVGSIMLATKPGGLVWGTGCIMPGGVGQPPKKIYAVRGPLTRYELNLKNIPCPEVYGDPALLYSKMYFPKINKKYKYGIIPHYIEYFTPEHNAIIKNLENQGIKIIDICAGKKQFINELLEVEKVISSSLHGLIAADAYGIPNARVNISNRLVGGHFKFKDYYMSVNRREDLGLQLTLQTQLKDIENLYFNPQININLDLLLNNAPWNDPENQQIFY